MLISRLCSSKAFLSISEKKGFLLKNWWTDSGAMALLSRPLPLNDPNASQEHLLLFMTTPLLSNGTPLSAVCLQLIFAQSHCIISNAVALDLDVTTAVAAHYHCSFYLSILCKSPTNFQFYPYCPRFCFLIFLRTCACTLRTQECVYVCVHSQYNLWSL